MRFEINFIAVYKFQVNYSNGLRDQIEKEQLLEFILPEGSISKLWSGLQLKDNETLGCKDFTSCREFLKWNDVSETNFEHDPTFMGVTDVNSDLIFYDFISLNNKVSFYSEDWKSQNKHYGVCQCYWPSKYVITERISTVSSLFFRCKLKGQKSQ